jgi:hypothetical protein
MMFNNVSALAEREKTLVGSTFSGSSWAAQCHHRKPTLKGFHALILTPGQDVICFHPKDHLLE